MKACIAEECDLLSIRYKDVRDFWKEAYRASRYGVSSLTGTDMQRAAAQYRKRFEDYIVRINELFSDAIHEQFPALSNLGGHPKPANEGHLKTGQ
jgi:hypothetical protein